MAKSAFIPVIFIFRDTWKQQQLVQVKSLDADKFDAK